MHKSLDESLSLSEKHANVSDFSFRVWAYALVKADGFGRLAATPRLVKAAALPLMTNYPEETVAAALLELQSRDLIHTYEAWDGKQYLVFHDHEDYNRTVRNLVHQKPKFPPPPDGLCRCVLYAQSELGRPDGRPDGRIEPLGRPNRTSADVRTDPASIDGTASPDVPSVDVTTEGHGQGRGIGTGTGRVLRGESEGVDVPSELGDLPLFAGNYKLCRRWAELLPQWVAAYPGVNVLAEVRAAHAWELSNTTRRKTDKIRFLNGWLARAQDRPRGSGGGRPSRTDIPF